MTEPLPQPPKECLEKVVLLKKKHMEESAGTLREIYTVDLHIQKILEQVNRFVESETFKYGSEGFVNLKGIPSDRMDDIQYYVRKMGLFCEIGSVPVYYMRFGLREDPFMPDLTVYSAFMFSGAF